MFKKFMTRFVLPGLLMMLSALSAADTVTFRLELDCRPSKGNITFGSIPGFTEKRYGKMVNLIGKAPLTAKWQKQTVEFTPNGDGLVILGLIAVNNAPDRWVDVDDIKIENAVVANPSFEDFAGDEAAQWRYYAESSFITDAKDAFHGKNYMRVNIAHAARQALFVKDGKKVKMSFMVRDGGKMAVPAPGFRSSSKPAGSQKELKMPRGNCPRITVDGFYSEVVLKDLKCSSNMKSGYAAWHTGQYGVNTTADFVALKPAGKKWQRYEVSFVPSRHGEVRFIIRASSSNSTNNGPWIDFDSFKASGVQEFRNPDVETVLAGYAEGWDAYPWNFRLNKKDAHSGKNYISATTDVMAWQFLAVKAGERVTISFYAKDGGLVTIPKMKKTPQVSEHDKDYYRVYNTRAKVKYLPLSDKGFKGEDIPELCPGVVTPDTPVPQAKFVTPAAKTAAKTDYIKVPFELLEESGIARDARIRFGFPMVKGQFFNLNNIRVLDPAGKEVPAQFSVLTFWPDKSIKSVLVQFTAPLKAKERANYFIEAGRDVTPARPSAGKLAYTDNGSVITVDTGVMKSVIDKKNFNFLKSVTVNGKYVGKFSDAGVVLTTEKGEKLTPASAPVQITLEEKGPYRLTFRVKGVFRNKDGEFFNCISRMSFYAGSSEVNFEVRFINTYLKTEFNDFKSIVMSFIPAAKPTALAIDNFTSDRIFQHHDKKLQVGDKFNTDRLSGSGSVKAGNNALTFNLFKAALRYPKAFSIDGNAVNFELLPAQPDKNFGNDLEYYLRFPLCEGFYRIKWGMGFRENLTIDFAGKTPAAALSAEEVIAIIDRDYVYSTAVYQGVQPKKLSNFDGWDAAAVKGFYAHMKLKERQREYGFLNYGDWFGERGRNWTNNEYDLPHGLFMLALRTGNRDAFRWAKIAAQHQADVDIIHAYPDKAFHGANVQHSIGHSGVSYQRPKMASWSLAYDYASFGTNGHIWSAGMCEAWMLCGDAETMNSALMMGEHLSNYVAPLFLRLTTHERSAGWSNIALVHIYRATSDPKYMAASKRLVGRIMGEQKKDLGGAWPHKLPGDHGSNKRDTYGNCPYLVGILLESLRQHYLINPDPAVKDSIIHAANWQHRSFRPDCIGWGYGVSWDNKPYNGVGHSLNMLCGPGVATGARLSGDEKLFNTAKLSAAIVMFTGFSEVGKALGLQLCMMPTYIDELNQFAVENPGVEPFRYSEAALYGHLSTADIPQEELDTKSLEFRIRGALHKEFRVTLRGKQAEVRIRRDIFGQRYAGEKDYSGKVIAPDGKVIKEFSGLATEKLRQIAVQVNGKPGDEFRILVRDDFKGIWHVEADGADAYAMMLRGMAFSSAGINSFNVHIPEGVDELPVRITAQHGGLFRIVTMDNNDKVENIIVGYARPGGKPWEKSDFSSVKTINFKPAADGSRARRVIVLASGDILFESKISGAKISLLK